MLRSLLLAITYTTLGLTLFGCGEKAAPAEKSAEQGPAKADTKSEEGSEKTDSPPAAVPAGMKDPGALEPPKAEGGEAPGAEGDAEHLVPAKVVPKELPEIYDLKSDMKVKLQEAQAKAKTDNKRVLVVFGGNWCTWCHKLQMLFDRDEVIAKKLADNYELVHIDSHSNEALIKEMGVELKGVPFLAVTDGEGKILVQQETGSLEEGPRHDPGKIGAFLDQWAAS